MVKLIFVFQYIHIALNGIFFENVIDLFQIVLSIFPYENGWDSFESVDKWEKEAMDKVMMMRGVEVIK